MLFADLLCRFVACFRIPAGYDHPGAVFSKTICDAPTDPLGCTRYERDLSGQVEE
jgi:hypothetical protein